MKRLTNAIFGTASEINIDKLAKDLDAVLIEGEQITAGFKIVRDLVVFTRCRIILIDKQGVTGKKTEYQSIPYKSISRFSVESAGHFDMDSELKIWISSNEPPIVREFKKGTDMMAIQRLIASAIFETELPSLKE